MPDAPHSHIQSRVTPLIRRVDTKLSVQGGGSLDSDLNISLVNDQDPTGFQYYGTDIFGERGWYGTFIASGPQHTAGLVPDPGPISGTTKYLCEDGLWKVVISGGGGGSGTSTSNPITQTSHGFAVGDVVRHTGTTYARAKADTSANAEVVGLVTSVADANTFIITTEGLVDGLLGLTAGTVYFLSTATAGLLTLTAPTTTGQISKPLLIASSTTGGYWFNWRGWTVGTGSGGGGGGGSGVTSITATAPIIVAPSSIVSTGVVSLDSTKVTEWDTAYSLTRQWDGGSTGLNASIGRTSLGLGTAAQSNTSAFEVPLTFSQSVVRATNVVTLYGDSGSPGASKYYGTDSGGTKGFFTLPAGGGGTPGGSTTQVQYNNAGAFGGISNATTDGTTLTLTSPKIITDIKDTNSAILLGVTPAASSVNYYRLGNSATNPILSTDGTSTNVSMILSPKGTGSINFTPTTGSNNRTLSWGANFGLAAMLLHDSGSPNQYGMGILGSELQEFIPTGGHYSWNKAGTMQATGVNEVMRLDNTSGNLALASGGVRTWSSTTVSSGTVDTGLSRNAAGVVEVNSGTAGTYRDLKLRNLILSGGTQIPAASPTGLFLKDDGTYATPAGGSGTPGGSDTQVQYNNAGAFGGIATAVYSGLQLTLTANTTAFSDLTDPTKQIKFDLSLSSTATSRNVIVAAGASPVIPNADAGTTNNFLTGITTGGVITKAQPAFSNFSGSATAAQMPAFTGDVTTTAGTVATTIGNNKVTLGMMATMATDSILGRATAATGNVEVLSALPFAFTGDVTRPVDSNAQTIAANAVTYGKMQAVSAVDKLLGSSHTTTAVQEITLGTNLSMSGATLNATGGATIASTGDILKGDGSGNAVALGTSTSGKVLKCYGGSFVPSTETYAVPGATGQVLRSNATNWLSALLNFSDLTGSWTLAQGPSTTASVLLGRGSTGSGVPQEITLGTNLSISGTTLNATGGGGGGGSSIGEGGITALVNGQAYIDVTFSTAQADALWTLAECEIVNTVDSTPLNISSGVITSKSTTGFRLQLVGLPDSSNYELHWSLGVVTSGVITQNPQAGNYTMVLTDSGKHIFHDSASVGHTYTIPANSSVAFPIGTTITIANNTGSGTITLAITTDTLRRGDGTAGTGSRTITADSVATILKTKSTEWMITGKFT